MIRRLLIAATLAAVAVPVSLAHAEDAPVVTAPTYVVTAPDGPTASLSCIDAGAALFAGSVLFVAAGYPPDSVAVVWRVGDGEQRWHFSHGLDLRFDGSQPVHAAIYTSSGVPVFDMTVGPCDQPPSPWPYDCPLSPGSTVYIPCAAPEASPGGPPRLRPRVGHAGARRVTPQRQKAPRHPDRRAEGWRGAMRRAAR